MKRLTYRLEDQHGNPTNSIILESDYVFMNTPEKLNMVLSRLAAIEDILGDEYDLDRLRELVEADKEGRCGIPPVKMHQKIFRVFDGEIYEETVCGAMWEPLMPRPRWKVFVMGSGLAYYWDDVFGKTVFLARSEAEKALKAREQDD